MSSRSLHAEGRPPQTPRQAVILAGGLGTRMRPLTDRLPKPLIDVAGRPFLDYLLRLLREQGIERVILLVGYLGDMIVDAIGDGAAYGLQITYGIGAPEHETGTRLRAVRDRVDATFLLLYCDNYWPLDLRALSAEYARGGRRAVTTVYANADGYTRDNVAVGSDGGIVTYDRTRSAAGLGGVDIGFGIFARDVLDLLPEHANVSFEAVVYPQLVATGQLGAFRTEHRYYSIGSFERVAETEEFLRRPKTVLLDRDGTLNVRLGPARYVTRWDEFGWEAGALDGLRELALAGYRVGVVTNQPGVARGALSRRQLDEVHLRMIDDAAAAGGRIDRVFVCEHGWDDGCACRKPKPGLLFAAQRELRLDLSRTTFIGDDARDGEAAAAAGCPFVRVGSGHATIAAAIDTVIKGERQFASAS